MDTIVRNININTYLEYNPILGTFRVFDFWGVLNLFALCCRFSLQVQMCLIYNIDVKQIEYV